MAFRLKPNESVRRGLRRIARDELRSARDSLRKSSPPADEAIHEARKAVKKVRAILALIAADHGSRLSGCEKRLRKINRTLSAVRDADAMVETLKKLKTKEPHILSEHAFARLRRELIARKAHALTAAQRDDRWNAIDREIRDIGRDAKRWRTAHRQLGALVGIRTTYRRGRKALARARGRQAAADFHQWRKQLKALWYQLRLIDSCAARIRDDVRLLHRLETWLGDDHNVVVLCAELSKDRSLCDMDRLKRVADRYQRALRRKALARAKRIYAEKPRRYLDRLKRTIAAWRRRCAADHQARSTRAA